MDCEHCVWCVPDEDAPSGHHCECLVPRMLHSGPDGWTCTKWEREDAPQPPEEPE
jgi:hypothetical protein